MYKFKEKIEKCIETENIFELDEYFKKLKNKNNKKEKDILSEAYLQMFDIFHFDFECGKINDVKIIDEMYDFVKKAEILTNKKYYSYYGNYFRIMEEISESIEDKIKNIKNAVLFFEKNYAYNDYTENRNIDYFEILFENIKLNIELFNKKSIDENLEKILQLFNECAENEIKNENNKYFFEPRFFSSFIKITYEILILNIELKNEIFEKFLFKFNENIVKFCEKDKIYYFVWGDILYRLIDFLNYKKINLSENIKNEIDEKLCYIENYETENENKLNRLGNIFERRAKEINLLKYYLIALKYYKKAWDINLQTWTYPVYAINVLKEIIRIEKNNKNIENVKKYFEEADKIFNKAYKILGDDEQLMYYYREFNHS